MNYQELIITPSIAEEMLKHNVRNRRLSLTRVKEYSKDILSDHWEDSPSPICFSSEGHLIDGQHRLHAVIAANKPVKMMVAYDVPSNSVIDRGLPRDPGSELYIRGLIEAPVSTRPCLAIVNRYRTTLNKTTHIRDYERADFINKHQDKLIATMEISKGGGNNALCKKAPVQAAILAALISGVSEDELTTFAKVVNTGFANETSQSSAIVLRNYLLENHASGHSAQDAIAACAQMAIRDFVNKSPRQSKYRRKYHVYINGEETVHRV